MCSRFANLMLLGVLVAIGCDPPGGQQRPPLSPTPTQSAAPTQPPAATPTEPAQRSPTERVENKTFDDLTFDIEPDAPFDRSMLTAEIEALNQSRIKIRGYILPTAQKRGIKQFVLVRDNMECCFGPGAALYDCILVEMTPGESAEFSVLPVAVTGTFRVEEFPGPEGRPLAVFQMRGEKVE